MASASTEEPPVPLAGPALDRWRELVGSREWKPGQLLELASYCAAYGRWVAAEAWLADPAHGAVITIRDDKGNVRSHGPAPQLAIAERSSKEAARLGRLLRV